MLNHTHALLTKFCGGVAPKGNTAPYWETSHEGVKLLLEKGIEYGPFVSKLDSALPDLIENNRRSLLHGT